MEPDLRLKRTSPPASAFAPAPQGGSCSLPRRSVRFRRSASGRCAASIRSFFSCLSFPSWFCFWLPVGCCFVLGAARLPNKHYTQFTALDLALNSSSVPCVKLLVQAGADVNVSRYFHPLAKAAEKGLTEAIKCLVEAGADANVPDTLGRLPIELAAEYGTWEDVEILFPVTSPIPTVPDWSVHGIISHVYMEVMQREDDDIVKKTKSDLKRSRFAVILVATDFFTAWHNLGQQIY
ncbi:hypothetical protein EJB05_50222, partial [Eragrostis curvula]